MSTTSIEIIRYKESDPLADAAAEVADVLGVPIETAAVMVSQELETYHFKRAEYPATIDQSTFLFIGMVTSSFRIAQMTERFDWIIQQLADTGTTVLDYGGGGGGELHHIRPAGKTSDLRRSRHHHYSLRSKAVCIKEARY